MNVDAFPSKSGDVKLCTAYTCFKKESSYMVLFQVCGLTKMPISGRKLQKYIVKESVVEFMVQQNMQCTILYSENYN